MKSPRLKRIVPALTALVLMACFAWAQDAPATPTANAGAPASPMSMPSQPVPGPAFAGGTTATASQQHVAPLALKAGVAADTQAGNGVSTQPANALTLHLIVGRSLFLNSAEKLRRVYVSNPMVLDAMTASQFEVVISAKAAGTSSLVLWSSTGQPRMYTVHIQITNVYRL
jgi:pilus assembly protein CpaC